MKVTFFWKTPALDDRSIAIVKVEIQKRLENLYLDWEFYVKNGTTLVYVQIKSSSHRDSLRAIYRLSAPIHNGSILLINDSVTIVY